MSTALTHERSGSGTTAAARDGGPASEAAGARGVLEHTRSSAFVPGTNLKGQVAGANWIFLRRRIPSDHCLCVGAAPLPTLTTLAGIAESVSVVVGGIRAARALERACRREGLTNVQVSVLGSRAALALPTACVDLVAIAGWRDRWRLRRDRRLAGEVSRVLRPDGEIYYEHRAFALTDRDTVPPRRRSTLPVQRFWLTPPAGQMHTAVPANDAATIDDFRRCGLYSPAVTVHSVTRVLKRASARVNRLRRRRAAASADLPDSSANGHGPSDRRSRGTRARLGSMLRSWIPKISRLLDHPLADRVIGRRGVLAAPVSDGPPDAPPEYLRVIAAASGVQLEHVRWGLAARGEYSSRKVLFVLTARARTASGPPSCIVKLVRSPALNARLENEHRALTRLEQLGIGGPGTLPRSLFFGYHAGLAVLGETRVDGEPFRQRTTHGPDCAGLRAALDFFRELGIRTGDRAGRPERAAADALGALLERFTQIYRTTAAERTFLESRIAVLASLRAPLPVVFQHGDAGPWNMLLTPGGGVALLDWEAAEARGLPLWDLFYFLHAYCIDAASAEGPRDPLAGFASHFMGSTALAEAVVDATHRYCADVGVPPGAIDPLFYTCWMHRALKESTRIERAAVDGGHYVNLLRWTIARRESPMLARLFTTRGPGCTMPLRCDMRTRTR